MGQHRYSSKMNTTTFLHGNYGLYHVVFGIELLETLRKNLMIQKYEANDFWQSRLTIKVE